MANLPTNRKKWHLGHTSEGTKKFSKQIVKNGPTRKKLDCYWENLGWQNMKNMQTLFCRDTQVKLRSEKTIQILTKIFGEQSPLFNTRWQCLNLKKKDCEDYTTFAGTVNRYCEKFRLSEITPDMFKCLIFIQRLIPSFEKEIRIRLLAKLEQDQKNNITKFSRKMPAYSKSVSWHSKDWRVVTLKYSHNKEKITR